MTHKCYVTVYVGREFTEAARQVESFLRYLPSEIDAELIAVGYTKEHKKFVAVVPAEMAGSLERSLRLIDNVHVNEEPPKTTPNDASELPSKLKL